VRRAWARVGLRGKLAATIALLTLAAIVFVLIAVRREVGEAVGAVLIGGAIGLAASLVAGRLLEEATLRERRFVSDASHELRTPLTAIRGQLEVLAREERPSRAEVERVTGVVLTEMSRIERLVGDLLTLARLDEGEPLRPATVAVEPFLRDLAGDAVGGTVALGEVPAGALQADPERLTQVIRNLLGNARRHAGPRGRVELSAVGEDGRLTIRVDDDGPGIPAAEREMVFDRFHRSQAGRDRHSGGSGLGLAIAQSIVEAHGGRIWAEPSPLGGARIALQLGGFEAQLGTA
jgi:two-component system, OmpR family, sensor kinase